MLQIGNEKPSILKNIVLFAVSTLAWSQFAYKLCIGKKANLPSSQPNSPRMLCQFSKSLRAPSQSPAYRHASNPTEESSNEASFFDGLHPKEYKNLSIS